MGGNSTLILQIALAVMLLLFLVASFFSARVWRIAHVLLTVLVFFGAGVFVVLTAAALKTHQEWQAAYDVQRKAVEEREVKARLLEEGMAVSARGEIEKAEESIETLTVALDAELYDRGRVWREVSPAAAEAGTITVSLVPPGAVAEETGPPRTQGIETNMILFAFKEQRTADGWLLPAEYLGEFRVTQKTDTTVTLAPTLPLDQAQIAAINRRDSTWALYEIMPVDAHEAFADLTREELMAIFPPQRVGLSGAAYERFLDEYARNWKQADPANDPQERVWKRVRFLRPHVIDVDAEGEPQRFAEVYYDPEGRAVPVSLRLGTAKEFDVGDVAVFDAKTADKLIEDRVAELDAQADEPAELFVRALRDYEFEFREMDSRARWLDEVAVHVRTDIDRIVSAGRGATVTVTYSEEEKDKLAADLAGFQRERDRVAAYLGRLTQQFDEIRNELSRLYNENLALAGELARLQRTLRDRIEQRVRDAAAPSAALASPTPVAATP